MEQNKLNSIDYKNTPKVLEVKNLRVNFKSDSGMVYAVRGVSFDLYKGETLCIVGESGSGKSVTSKTIMGILANNAVVESGQILYEGEDLIRVSEEEFHRIRGHKIGMIFQDPLSSLNPICRVGKQITEATLINKNILKRHYNELISKELVNLRNSKANADYEINRLDNELNKINGYIKFLNTPLKNQDDEEQVKKHQDTLEEITEFCSLFVRDDKKLLEETTHELDALKNTRDFDSRYLEEEINSKKIELINEKLELLKTDSKSYEGKENLDSLTIRKEFLEKLKEYTLKEYKALKPLLKTALTNKKKARI